MQVILAEAMGMCFGVRDALAAAERVAEPAGVTVLGDLVHNPEVARRLAARGFGQVAEGREVPEAGAVLITAHGISDRRRAALGERRVIDTTCPLVRKAHEAAKRLAAEGCFVVVIGRRGHVEVLGLTGDLPACVVVQSVEEVVRYAEKRIGVVCQTTTAEGDAGAIVRAIVEKNPQAQIRFVDTICQPTKERQRAMERLLGVVDAVVVVGGLHSNNTCKLVEQCVARGVRAFHVESAEGLRQEWFAECRRVGLTAGTSTLPETVGAVRAWLEGVRG